MKKHKHRPCPCGCGELADECMRPSSGLGAFQITEPVGSSHCRWCPFAGCDWCGYRGADSVAAQTDTRASLPRKGDETCDNRNGPRSSLLEQSRVVQGPRPPISPEDYQT